MHRPRIDDMKAYVGFGDADARNIVELSPDLLGAIPRIVDHFYEEAARHPDAISVFTGGADQINKQRSVLEEWMRRLFVGSYDEAYFASRIAIGEAHVRVVLPQHYMITAMEVVWQGFESAAQQSNVTGKDVKLRSLRKLLSLELCVMLEAYRASYASKIRETEHSRVEERLTRAEHLAEIGQLAASLAHEIKNPLAGISGAIQIIRDGMANDNQHRPIIAEILSQVSRLDAAVKDLLLYARPTPPTKQECRLGDMVRRMLTLLMTEPALKGIEVDFDPSLEDVVICCDEGQIEQLFINLVLNAAHACSREIGCITVAASDREEGVEFVVSDNGAGMSKDICERAMEPFYTTKARGTGLGLPICRRIVESHGGRMTLQSEPGQGTRASVFLPGMKQALSVAPA